MKVASVILSIAFFFTSTISFAQQVPMWHSLGENEETIVASHESIRFLAKRIINNWRSKNYSEVFKNIFIFNKTVLVLRKAKSAGLDDATKTLIEERSFYYKEVTKIQQKILNQLYNIGNPEIEQINSSVAAGLYDAIKSEYPDTIGTEDIRAWNYELEKILGSKLFDVVTRKELEWALNYVSAILFALKKYEAKIKDFTRFNSGIGITMATNSGTKMLSMSNNGDGKLSCVAYEGEEPPLFYYVVNGLVFEKHEKYRQPYSLFLAAVQKPESKLRVKSAEAKIIGKESYWGYTILVCFIMLPVVLGHYLGSAIALECTKYQMLPFMIYKNNSICTTNKI